MLRGMLWDQHKIQFAGPLVQRRVGSSSMSPLRLCLFTGHDTPTLYSLDTPRTLLGHSSDLLCLPRFPAGLWCCCPCYGDLHFCVRPQNNKNVMFVYILCWTWPNHAQTHISKWGAAMRLKYYVQGHICFVKLCNIFENLIDFRTVLKIDVLCDTVSVFVRPQDVKNSMFAWTLCWNWPTHAQNTS